MSNAKITQLPAWNGALAGTELVEIVAADGTSRKLTSQNLFKEIGVLPAQTGLTPTGYRLPLYKIGTGEPVSATISDLVITAGNMPAGGAQSAILYKVSGTNYDAAWSITPTLGVSGTSKGTLSFAGNTSGTVTVQPAAAAGTWSLTLPTSGGTSGYALQTDGSGVSSWAGFLQAGTGAVARTWQAKDRDIVSVKDFGAAGDGVTNDTAAIQAAVTTGNSVYFPSGTYLISTAITFSTVGQMFYGAGMEKSTISLSGAISGFVASGSLIRCVFRDIGISGGSSSLIGVDTSSGLLYETVFQNVLISTGQQALYIPDEFSNLYQNVQFSSVHNHGVEIEGHPTSVFISCYAHNVPTSGKYGFRIYSGGSFIGCNGIDSGESVILLGQDTGHGDAVNTQYDAVFVNCNFEDFTKQGVRLRYNGVAVFQGCKFAPPSAGTYDASIWIEYCDRSVQTYTTYTTSKGATRNKLAEVYSEAGIAPVCVASYTTWDNNGVLTSFVGSVLNINASSQTQMSTSPTLGVAGTTAGKVVLSGLTSGTTTLQPSAVASGTLTLPAAIDTLVGKATSDTLSNKAIIIGGAAAGSTLALRSTSGVGTTDAILFQLGNNGATEIARFNSTGLGINITPTFSLHVLGSGRLQNATAAAVFDIGTTDINNAALRYFTNNSTRWYVGVDSADSSKYKLSANTNDFTGSKVTVTVGGLVGIGTTAPGSLLSLGLAGTTLGVCSFAGSTSGTTTLQPNVAASGTLTLPAATDTLVGQNTTDTLTNKTLTSPTMTAPVLGVATGTSISTTAASTAYSGTATPAAASAVAGFKMGSASVGWYWGTGTPVGNVTAAQGSFYSQTDGSSTSSRVWVNTNAGTAWASITTSS